MSQNLFEELLINISDVDAFQIEQRLVERGAATFRVEDFAELREWATSLGPVFHHPHADPDGVTVIETRARAKALGQRGFSPRSLYPHTDRSSLARPPSLLLFWCEASEGTGGETMMVDGLRVLRKWQQSSPEELDLLMNPTHFILSSDAGTVRRPIIEQWGRSAFSFRFRNDEGIHCSAAALTQFRRLLNYIEAGLESFPLMPGSGYIIQNTRWLHGRREFSGRRRCCRLLLTGIHGGSAKFESFRAGDNHSTWGGTCSR